VTSAFRGPPWQADWTKEAESNRDALPAPARALVDAARAELVTAKDPYFRGIDSDRDLPAGMSDFLSSRSHPNDRPENIHGHRPWRVAAASSGLG
jgi:hypothetical protein